MNLFSQAAQGLPLTPAQRAFLKLLKGWFYTALGVGIIAGTQYVMGTSVIDWQKLLYIVGTGVLLSLLQALDKYWTAQGDIPLALATQAAEQRVQQAVQAVTTPAQQPQKALEILGSPNDYHTGSNMTTLIPPAQQPPIQQVPFPPAQPIPFLARPQLGTANLADVPPAESDTTRHFGDTGIIPTV